MFKVGDRVKMIRGDEKVRAGMRGTVLTVQRVGVVGVEWEKLSNGFDSLQDDSHTSKKCKPGRGWHVTDNEIEEIKAAKHRTTSPTPN